MEKCRKSFGAKAKVGLDWIGATRDVRFCLGFKLHCYNLVDLCIAVLRFGNHGVRVAPA